MSCAFHRPSAVWPGVAVALVSFALALPSRANAAFPGANGKIAFTTDRDGPRANYEIYSMNPDGSGLTNLTNNPVFGFDGEPAWSPTGTKIAFMSTRTGDNLIYVMNADGSGLTNLQHAGQRPTWSPDGTKIAFVDTTSTPTRIWTMNADGSGATMVTPGNTAASDTNPAWSPDGSSIAFSSNRSDLNNGDIYTVRPDGTELTRLTTDPAPDGSPSWSPDGTKIAFESTRGGKTFPGIYMMNADGSGTINLTDDPAGDFDPAWSPDGTKIAFASNRSGGDGGDIFTINPDGTGSSNLTNNPAIDTLPDWQPIVPYADLAVSQSDSPDPVLAGDVVTYTVTVVNNGPSTANGITVTDSLPRSVRVRSARSDQGSCTVRRVGRTNVVTCELSDLANGESATITIVGQPTRKQTVTSTASVSAVDPADSEPSNNTATETTTVKP